FQPPVRLLVVVSRPAGTGFIDPRSSAAPLLDALDPLGDAVAVEFLRPPTLAALNARLRDRDAPPVHVVHFDGHGVYDPAVGLGFLLFEDDRQERHDVDAEQLGALLNECGIPLMVLDACQTATPDERNPFASVAARLIESGVGAIVAMNYSVLVETAKRLTGHLYRGLAQGKAVSAAL
ncbi:MAG: CHAT domain-containing protein, partial [Anaerolineae bacterium]|nr:CHAT domain-containing protein [Anaerolineae bacterium]